MFKREIQEAIGNTSIVELNRIQKKYRVKANIFGKIEAENPGGSIKDRAAKYMIDDAETDGRLEPGSVIVEPTSGNTGIGLSMIGCSKGYRVIITMPETMSIERQKLIKSFGAEVILTPGSEGVKGAIARAEKLVGEMDNAFMPGQFTNSSNPKSHFETTGPEIWRDMDGKVDILICGVGTGGTVTGTGKFLKSMNSDVHVVAVEPEESPILSGGQAGPHGIQGIGAGFVPEILEVDLLDEVFRVKTEDAIEAAREVAQTDGTLIGISGGAVLWAAIRIGLREENSGKNIVVIFPDTGERYLSTDLFKGI